jgi:hypothetical protein
VRALSPVTELLTISIGAIACTWAEREYRPHLRADTLKTVLSQTQVFARTRWLDEILQRYLFEREVCAKHASAARCSAAVRTATLCG